MNKQTYLIGFTLVCCVFSWPAHAAKKNPPKKNEEVKPVLKKEPLPLGHYFLHVPKGWECIADKSQLPAKVEMVLIGSGKGQFTPSINLATEKTEMPIDEYVKLAKHYHESQGETTCRPLGKLETKEGSIYLLQIDRNTQWGIVRFIQSTLIKEGCAYVITATCLMDDFNEFSTQFFKTIQSFTINQT